MQNAEVAIVTVLKGAIRRRWGPSHRSLQNSLSIAPNENGVPGVPVTGSPPAPVGTARPPVSVTLTPPGTLQKRNRGVTGSRR